MGDRAVFFPTSFQFLRLISLQIGQKIPLFRAGNLFFRHSRHIITPFVISAVYGMIFPHTAVYPIAKMTLFMLVHPEKTVKTAACQAGQ